MPLIDLSCEIQGFRIEYLEQMVEGGEYLVGTGYGSRLKVLEGLKGVKVRQKKFRFLRAKSERFKLKLPMVKNEGIRWFEPQ